MGEALNRPSRQPGSLGGLPSWREIIPENDPVLDRIEKETKTAPVHSRSTEVYADGPRFFYELESQIANAKKSIDINIFSWAPDHTGQRITKNILEAKQQNPQLSIRIRVDFLGSLCVGGKQGLKDNMFSILRLLPELPIEAKAVQNLMKLLSDASSIHTLPRAEQEQLNTSVQALMNNERVEQLFFDIHPQLSQLKSAGVKLIVENNAPAAIDHSKVFIFDETTIFTGGMNIGDDYSGGFDSKKGWTGQTKAAWKDYMVQMTGEAANLFRNQYFNDTHTVERGPGDAKDAVHVLHNKGGETPTGSSLAEHKPITWTTYHLLSTAKKEILIEHAYVTDPNVLRLLREAADRNVKITLIRSRPESPALEAANARAFAQLNDHKNITIVPASRVLHTKLLCVDGRYALIGSANLDRESGAFFEETSMLFTHNDVQRNLHTRLEKFITEALEKKLGQ